MKSKKKNKPKTREPVYFNQIPCDSPGEIYMCHYWQELKDNGFIKEFKRGQSYLLSDSLVNNYVEQLKTKSRPKTETILHGHSFNLDFEIHWEDKGVKKFCTQFGYKWNNYFICNELGISYIESKPSFDFNNMTRLATLNIKWLWAKYGIFCQVVKNDDLFSKTFMPKTLLKTSKGKDRKFNFKTRSLEQYLAI